MAELDEVIKLATALHAGQLDKSGRPYVGHLERVADMVRHSGGNWVQEQAAWLHDSIEDTLATYEYLLGKGVPDVVVRIVDRLTHLPNELNGNYWDRILMLPSARLVKLCDIYDNLSPSRMCYLLPEDQKRLRLKYADAISVLA